MHLEAREPISSRWPGGAAASTPASASTPRTRASTRSRASPTLLDEAGFGAPMHWTDARGWFAVFWAPARADARARSARLSARRGTSASRRATRARRPHCRRRARPGPGWRRSARPCARAPARPIEAVAGAGVDLDLRLRLGGRCASAAQGAAGVQSSSWPTSISSGATARSRASGRPRSRDRRRSRRPAASRAVATSWWRRLVAASTVLPPFDQPIRPIRFGVDVAALGEVGDGAERVEPAVGLRHAALADALRAELRLVARRQRVDDEHVEAERR